jgi:hypothetical protein
MEMWMLADLDCIIRDFVDQLRAAEEEGWEETRPAHFRALAAALESALRERQAQRVVREGVEHGEPVPAEAAAPASLPWPWRPAHAPALAIMKVSRRPA